MISEDFSRRIAILRPLLIFLILTTHTYGTLYRPDLQPLSWSLGTYLFALLTGVVATCALPLLSVISGYLAGALAWRKPYLPLLWRKVRTLLVPMLFWNLVMAVWIYQENAGGRLLRSDLALYPFAVEQWFYALTSLFRIPANPPLYFLRELFLCFLFFPLFKLLARWYWAGWLLVAFVAYCYLSETHFGFFIRIDIYGFFMLGMLLARHQWAERVEEACLPWFGWILAVYLACCLALARYAFEDNAAHFLVLMKSLTLFGPLVFWLLGRWLQKGAPGRFLAWLSPAAFPTFLGHCVVITLVYEVLQPQFGPSLLNELYPLYWTLCVVLSFALMGGLRLVWRWLRTVPGRIGAFWAATRVASPSSRANTPEQR